MCPKIDVMERECKNLKFGSDLNKTLNLILQQSAAIGSGSRKG
jgi:hypothetical protein